MAEAGQNGLPYEKAKELFPGVTHQTVETRKSMYEELGLLYVPKNSDELHLTEIGAQLLNLLGTHPPIDPNEELQNQVASLLSWAMIHTQINRPQSLGSPQLSPTDREQCDIRPYAAFWKAIFDLDGYITFSEFSSVLAHVQTANAFPAAIQTILESRKTGVLPNDPGQSANFRIYWNSHLSVAGLVLSIEDDVFRFVPGRQEILRSILQFQMGCEENDAGAAIRAQSWNDINEYYSLAGQQCPAFIASGQVKVVSFNKQPLILLENYTLGKEADGTYFVDGGIDLCSLKIKMPCFHASELNRLLRVEIKAQIGEGQVRVRFGLGRPINDASQLLRLWNELWV